MRRGAPAAALAAPAGLLAALLILLAAVTPSLHAQSAPSISVELTPGPHLPHTVALTGEVTLSNLDFAIYSMVTLRADVTGHEDRSSQCYGDDTGTDIDVAVDESREVRTLALFKPCLDVPGGFGTYDYAITLSVARADPMQPGDTIELASLEVDFLVSTYLTPGEQTFLPLIPVRWRGLPRTPELPRCTWESGDNSASAPTFPSMLKTI